MFKQFPQEIGEHVKLSSELKNITSGEAGLLILVSLNPGLKQTAFAKVVGIESSTMTDVIDRYEKAGILERRPFPNDRRSRALHLTPTGKNFVVSLIDALKEMEREFTKSLDKEERKILVDLLNKLFVSNT